MVVDRHVALHVFLSAVLIIVTLESEDSFYFALKYYRISRTDMGVVGAVDHKQ